jgi:hypothetical protein
VSEGDRGLFENPLFSKPRTFHSSPKLSAYYTFHAVLRGLVIFILILISGAYFLKFWEILKCQNPKPVSICGWKLSRVLWEMPGFGGKCPLPDLGATVRVSKLCFFCFYFTNRIYTSHHHGGELFLVT